MNLNFTKIVKTLLGKRFVLIWTSLSGHKFKETAGGWAEEALLQRRVLDRTQTLMGLGLRVSRLI